MPEQVLHVQLRIRVWLQNTGGGPTQDIQLSVWVRESDDYLAGPELVEEGAAYWKQVGGTKPDLAHVLSSIGAGQRDVMVYLGRRPEIAGAAGFGLLAYAFEHRDVFDRQLPRTKPSKRRPGFANIVPDWDPEFSGDALS